MELEVKGESFPYVPSKHELGTYIDFTREFTPGFRSLRITHKGMKRIVLIKE